VASPPAKAVGFLLLLNAPRHLGADALDRPAAKVLVQVARRRLQLQVGQLVIE